VAMRVSMANGIYRRYGHGRLFFSQSGRSSAQSNGRIARLKVECSGSFHRHQDLDGGRPDWKQLARHKPQVFRPGG